MLHYADKKDHPDFKQESEKPSKISPTQPVPGPSPPCPFPDVPQPGLAYSLLLQTWIFSHQNIALMPSCEVVLRGGKAPARG